MKNTNRIGSVLFTAVLMIHGTGQAQEATSELPKRDAALYTCMTCHGTDGQGNPVVGAPGLDGREAWYLRRQLENFRAGIRGTQDSYTPGLEMQAAASVLDDESIDRILVAIEDWRPRPVHAGIDGDPQRGRQVYGSCATCHGQDGQGIEAVGAPALAGKADWYLMNQLRLFLSGYRGTHPEDSAGAQMRSMTQSLDVETTMRDVVAYIRTIGETGEE